LAEDVRYYGQWMRDEAEKRIGHLYPKVEVTAEMAKERPDLKPLISRKLTVIVCLWARTVKSPNPAFADVDVPLATTFMLSTRAGKEAYVEPVIEGGSYRFTVNLGMPKDAAAAKYGTKSGTSGSSFFCLMSGTPLPFEYLRQEAKAGRMGFRLMALVAEGGRGSGRVYLLPTLEMEAIARSAQPQDVPETDLPKKALGFRIQEYGMTQWRDLFTPRQLASLTALSDLVKDVRERVTRDALNAGLPPEDKPLDVGGAGARAYADAIAVYLGLTVSKSSNTINALAVWSTSREQSVNLFSRQAIPMAWDFPEVNPFAGAAGDFALSANSVAKSLANCPANLSGVAYQKDAQNVILGRKLVSTDPPYYDNIGYADLSDFFYIWLRRSLKPVLPDLFATLAVPKAEELIATPYRHGSREKAEAFFLGGMTQAMHRLSEQAHPGFPVTIYYAFKQSETNSKEGTSSTGWETFLEAVIDAGFGITGTWPMRTERDQGVKTGKNVLASSIILVCRPHAANAPVATRREFLTALKAELPAALKHLQRSNIAPVDLAQAAIGPGMAVYTRYAKVLDAEGKPVSVRDALALINQTLDEALAEQEGDFDADSRWALAWFEHAGFDAGEYGVAETLSKAKNTSVDRMVEAGAFSLRRAAR
jgi:putative DNA methylase